MTTHPTAVASPPAAAEPSAPHRAGRRWRWFGWALLALVVLWAIFDGKREVGRWYCAAAQVEFARGHGELGQAYLQRAMEWAPTDYEPYRLRGRIKLERKDYAAALDDLDRALKLGGNRYDILVDHSSALQHLGRHRDAVEDLRRIERLTRTPSLVLRESWYNLRRATDLNGLAYAQALAKIDLDEALENIDAALELFPPDFCRTSLLETRAFIYCQRGEYQRSIDEMNAAFDDLQRVQSQIARLRAEGKEEQAKYLGQTAAFAPEALAVLYYHRALAYQGLGKEEEAEEDLARARELIGREPDESLF